MEREVELVSPHGFEADRHFYPKALNAHLHPMVDHFFNLNHQRIVQRYHHLNPQVSESSLMELLQYKCKHFMWGGSDLFYVTTEMGNRRMIVLETNSCPSGQKSMPSRGDSDEYRGYRNLIEQCFLPELKRQSPNLPAGALAVIYDKNYMENSGYAETLAELTGEEVYLIPHYDTGPNFVDFQDGVMHVTDKNGQRHPIRAAFRYVTQKPWNRIPIECKTLIFNSTLVCLAGGRNKLVANKAYELFNSEISGSGLKIRLPETIRDVSKLEVPLWIQRFGGFAVIKNPYSNAGQGVYTITNDAELEEFMQEEHHYDQFIIQSLIGHYDWSSQSHSGRYYHIGTIPNKKGNIYVADLRMMVYSGPDGFSPCAVYARKASYPLTETIPPELKSWQILGTNLSIKKGENEWDSDTSRLMLMDRKDFNNLGIGTDDLIEAFIQSVLSVIAIDKMAERLLTPKGQFRMKLFRSLNRDDSLIKEIMV